MDIELKDTDVLCERHFRENDIIRNDEVTLANGDKYISPRQIFKLAQNAVPIRLQNNNEEINEITIDSVNEEISQVNHETVICDEDHEAQPEIDCSNVTIRNEITDDIILNAADELIEGKETEAVLADEISLTADNKLPSIHELFVSTTCESGDVSWIRNIREKLPAEWQINKYSNAILLSHINPVTFEMKKRIKIMSDMTIEVIF